MEFGVCYPLANGHCDYVLSALEKQREDGSLCDIILQVGSSQINAHRGVLAVCSDYFSAMFSGAYVEKDSKMINLSETFRNAEALERIIVSMYRGTLEIKKSDDICDLLETCSILLFDDAKKQCVDCLKTRLCLRNGLKFWFAADRYLNEKPKRRFRFLVESHFHDYYINQPEMTKMSARDLSVLFHQGFHKFCSLVQLLDFLLRWYATGQTKDDLKTLIDQAFAETVPAEIQDVRTFLSNPELLAKEFSLSPKSCEEFCSVAKTLVIGNSDGSLLPLAPSSSVILKENVSEIQQWGDNLCTFTRSSMHSDMLLGDVGDADLNAVLVVAPTPHILEQRFHLYMYYSHIITQQFHPSDTLPLFHVSAYIPKRRTWFQLGQISSPPGLSGEKLTRFFDSCLMEQCDGQLYVIGESGDKNMRCDLETFQWEGLPSLKPFHPTVITEDMDGMPMKSRERIQIVQPIATSCGFYAAVASQQDEIVHLGLMELVEPTTEAAGCLHWVEKVPFEIPPALFGFTLLTAYHCVRDDRFVYLVVIGRMHSVHCRATCLAKYDLHLGTVAFLPVPEEYLMEPYHWTLFEQKGFLYLAHKTTFLYRIDLNVSAPVWTNCSELMTIKGDFKLPSLYAKSWGKFRRLNGVSASKESLWVMAEKRLVDRWHSISLWEVQVNMDSDEAHQQVKRHVPSPYSCYSLAVPVKLPARRLKGAELCQCVHAE